jgi:hypothetical protein
VHKPQSRIEPNNSFRYQTANQVYSAKTKAQEDRLKQLVINWGGSPVQ